MFFIKTIQKRLRERAEQKRIKEEKKRKWRERKNQYYDLGDIIYHTIDIGASAISPKCLGAKYSHKKGWLSDSEITWQVDKRLFLKIRTFWDSDFAKELGRVENQFCSIPEIFHEVTFYIDGIPIDYEYEKYRSLSTVVLDAVQKKVGEVATKRENLVEDYLNGGNAKHEQAG